MNARVWETAARNQYIRALNAETEREDLYHAINLLINESIEWSLTIQDGDRHEHKFGIGVAWNQPIAHPFGVGLHGRTTEDRCIVFWLTTHTLEDGRRLASLRLPVTHRTPPRRAPDDVRT